MPDINLLSQTTTDKRALGSFTASLIVKILGIILILILIYYGYLWFATRQSDRNLESWKQRVSEAQTKAINQKDRQELITRQGQLKQLDGIIKDHISWSYLFPEIARVTLSSTNYANITAESDGKLSLTVNAANYEQLDKYLQAFNLPQFNKQFSDVKVLSMSKVQEGSTVKAQMRIQLKFNPDFIRKFK